MADNRKRGVEHHAARLTEEQVREILNPPETLYGYKARLARKYGVSLTQIYRIRAGLRWRHLSENKTCSANVAKS